jgi:hypothetical protein
MGGVENAGFGAGGVVLVQAGDGFEQLGAEFVVEKLRADVRRFGEQTFGISSAAPPEGPGRVSS